MSTAPIDPPYTVVVGVSTTSKSPAALVWAAAQAEANHGRLIAVRVLRRPSSPDPSNRTSQGPHAEDTARQQAELAADVAAALGPEHQAECRVLHGGKRKSLLAAAASADLLVIDAARTPSASSLLAHRIIAAAQCPVVVLPPAMTGEPPSGISRVGETMLRAVGTSGRPGYRPPEQP